jgi:transposase
VPGERSSADSVWRGHITGTGSKHARFQLVESARLCRRFRQLERCKHITGVAVVAVARELAGSLQAEMQA